MSCVERLRANATLTFDSNVSYMSRLVSTYLFGPSKAWCATVGNCKRPSGGKKYLLYDTPISMWSDSAEIARLMPDGEFTSFVYIDAHQRNSSLARITENVKGNKRCVIITNSEQIDSAYRLITQNCTENLVAEIIAAIINTFRYEGQLMHPDDIIRLIMGKRAKGKLVTTNMTFDIPLMIQKRNRSKGEIKDCVVCSYRST